MNLASVAPAVLAEWPDTQCLYVFGSHARGDARAESDLDLAVLVPTPLDPVARWHAQERLAAALGIDVDLVDLRSASTVLRSEVVHNGTLLLDAKPEARALFEALTLSAYARLQEERRGILADIAERGHVQ